jgi:hypothetical protein
MIAARHSRPSRKEKGDEITTLKEKLLAHYAKQETREFLLVDVRQVAPGFDAENDSIGLHPNEDGLCVMIGGSTQLDECAGEGGVRLLIGRKMTPEKFRQALQHILEEVDLPMPRSELESIAAEAMKELYESGELVKSLDSAGRPVTRDGKQVFKLQKFASDQERAFYRVEHGIGSAPVVEDPPDLARLRAKAALTFPSLLKIPGPGHRRRGDEKGS